MSTTATPGGSTTYTIVVTNDGPSPAIDTVVTDAIPAGATAVAWTCAPSVGAACRRRQRQRCDQHDRRPPAADQCHVHRHRRHRPRRDGHPRQHGRRRPGPGVNDPDDPSDRTATDSDALTPRADLSITKDDRRDHVDPRSADHVHDRRARNDGPSVVTNAAVTDTLPIALTSATWACVATPGSNCDDAAGTGRHLDHRRSPRGRRGDVHADR